MDGGLMQVWKCHKQEVCVSDLERFCLLLKGRWCKGRLIVPHTDVFL